LNGCVSCGACLNACHFEAAKARPWSALKSSSQ
jgi:ferredoxin